MKRHFLRTSGMATGAFLAGPALLPARTGSDSMARIGLTTAGYEALKKDYC